jgi:hypothetical protein
MNVVELRRGTLKVAAARQSRQQLATNIVALLRRRGVTPLQGRTVSVEFETEAEASAFQKLICALPRRRRTMMDGD